MRLVYACVCFFRSSQLAPTTSLFKLETWLIGTTIMKVVEDMSQTLSKVVIFSEKKIIAANTFSGTMVITQTLLILFQAYRFRPSQLHHRPVLVDDASASTFPLVRRVSAAVFQQKVLGGEQQFVIG